MRQAERRGIDRAAIAGPDRVRLARDLHARPRRQRLGRDQRPAAGLRRRPPTRSSSRTRRASPATPWVRASRRSWRSRRWRPASCRRSPNFREPDPELGPLNLSSGGRLSGHLCSAAGRRLRLADRDDRCCAGPRRRTASAAAQRARLRLPDRRPGGLARLAGRVSGRERCPASRSYSTACGSPTTARSSAPAVPARPAEEPAVAALSSVTPATGSVPVHAPVPSAGTSAGSVPVPAAGPAGSSAGCRCRRARRRWLQRHEATGPGRTIRA